MSLSRAACLFLGSFLLSAVYAAPPDNSYSLAFQEDFNGTTLDLTKWHYRTGTSVDSVNDDSNVTVANGVVRIDGHSIPGATDSAGGIISNQKFLYGYCEATLRGTDISGWHSSIWLYDSINEIDICELPSNRDNKLTNNAHWWLNPHGTIGQKFFEPANFLTSSTYHTYGVEWTPTTLNFYLDGALIRTTSYPGPHSPMRIYLTLCADLSDFGNAPIPGCPYVPHADAHVSFGSVRFYQKAGLTPPSNSIVVDNSISGSGYVEAGSGWVADDASLSYNSTANSIARHARKSNVTGDSAIWRPNLSASGNYTVYAWVLNRYDTTSYTYRDSVTYDMFSNSRSVHNVITLSTVNSGQQWVKIGTFYMNNGDYLKLTIPTGSQYILTDAVAFSKQ